MNPLLAFLFVWYHGLSTHPFHASVCEIEYNQQSKSLELSYRMFSDDLEETLTGYSGSSVDILNPKEKGKIDSLTEKYLSEKFKIWINGEEQPLGYLGSDLDNGALWCFIEVKDVQRIETVEIDNSVMLEIFDDQINLVHFSKEDQVRSLKLYKDHTYGILKLADLWE